eukprot:CAMPEP_0115729890 /NCGR_PEP_ID=MMETSP0272-20121206/83754_1 /TAXON_ID=71861 /ORGANISM="Scrippsiella trochoidea, Strain CCMP3099" /LENGTH=89 /DNA_ID=CAMNT_0003173613 /DNA_START=26 /DNA_END=291 /DNA_ORIENTATION=+
MHLVDDSLADSVPMKPMSVVSPSSRIPSSGSINRDPFQYKRFKTRNDKRPTREYAAHGSPHDSQPSHGLVQPSPMIRKKTPDSSLLYKA